MNNRREQIINDENMCFILIIYEYPKMRLNFIKVHLLFN